MTTTADTRRGDARWCAAYAVPIVALWLAVGGIRPFGETAAHFERTAAWSSPLAAFDPALLPARPLQWVATWIAQQAMPLSPHAVRLPMFAMHWLLACAVHRWLRRRGATPGAAAVAGLLVVAAPVHLHLVWLVAAAYPLRVLAAFAACTLWWSHAAQASHRRAGTAVLLFFVCLIAHESAIVMAPVLLSAWLLRRGRAGVRAALRDPWSWLVVALAVWRVLDVGVLRPVAQYHGKPLAALPGNTARALGNLLPEPLREPLFDALRGHYGPPGLLLAAVPFAAVAGAFLWLFAAGSPVRRFVVAAAVLEQVPGVLFVGVTPRNLHPSLAFLAVAIGLALAETEGRRRRVATVLAGGLLLSFATESIGVARALRTADQIAQRLLDDVHAARAAAPAATLVLVDVPDAVGNHGQVPFLVWGANAFLRINGVEGPVLVFRTTAAPGSTDILPIDAAELTRRADAGEQLVLRCEAATGRLTPMR